MTAVSRVAKHSYRVACAVAFVAATAIAAQAQTGILFLPPVNVRLSTNGAGFGSSAITFSSALMRSIC